MLRLAVQYIWKGHETITRCNPVIYVTQGDHALNANAWPYNVGRVTLLSYALSITEQKKFWELLTQRFNRGFKFVQQHATTCNRVRKRKQHVTASVLASVGQEFCVRLHEASKSC